MDVVNHLISLGALDPEPPRDSNAKKREAEKRRRAMIKNAKELGEAPPIFQKGRPRKYFTPEETRVAQNEYNRKYKRKVKELTRRGVQALVNQGRSNDSNSGLVANESQPG